MNPILIATASVAVIGFVIGVLLVNVGKKFAVEVDEKEAAIRECLPGNNCGGCGYAGCDAMAAAIASGEAPVNGCPVGGDSVATQIGHIMGVEASAEARMIAFVKCSGDCDHTSPAVNYVGIEDCASAAAAGLGTGTCVYGCMGFGSCVKACPFNAIRIVNGVAVVDRSMCKACGKCVAACPKHLIELIPDTAKFVVKCSSKDRGPAVKAACTAGCIGCRLCTRQCESGAIEVNDNLAKIDYSKCVNCGKCAEKCPSRVIRQRYE